VVNDDDESRDLRDFVVSFVLNASSKVEDVAEVNASTSE